MKFFGRTTLYDIATTVILTSLFTALITASFVKDVLHEGTVLSATAEPTRYPTRLPTITRVPSPTRSLNRAVVTPRISLSPRVLSITPRVTSAPTISTFPDCKPEANTISKGRKLDLDALIKKIDIVKGKPGTITICKVGSTAVVLTWNAPLGHDLPIRYKVYVQENGGTYQYRTSAYVSTVQLDVSAAKEYKYRLTAVYKTGTKDTDLVESSYME